MKKRYLLLIIFALSYLPIYAEEVILGGDSIGIKLEYDGLLVIGHYDINHENNPNKHIKINDRIVKVNNQSINNIVDLQLLVENCKQDTIPITLKREDTIMNSQLVIQKDQNNQNHHGLYLKEETLGIATITYYDPNSNRFASLGHEISDSNGNLVSFDHGSCYDVTIHDIKQSSKNHVGQKIGQIHEDQPLGIVDTNCIYGIYGSFDHNMNGENISTANYDEINLGKAYCYVELNNNEIVEYEIAIIEKAKNYENEIKNFKIQIKDQALLKQTGGIIQGMSGSPIVQNGKLIGAITHVIADDPTKGYGIFIGNMLNETTN